MIPHPRTPEDITAAWIEETLALAGERTPDVSSVEVEVVGHGFTGTIARVALAGPHHRHPASLIVKLPHGDEEARDQIWQAGIYQREARFYGELADRIPLRTPWCFRIVHDRDRDLHVIVLEDLSSADFFDQVNGCPPDRAGGVVDDLAVLHRTFWGAHDELGLDRAVDDTAWFEMTEASITTMLERDDLTPDLVWLTERYTDIGRLAVQRLAERPTVQHADARIENVFFHADGTRSWIDWDGVQLGGAGYDVAYFLSQSLRVDDRRRLERDLVARYVAGLDHADYTLEDAWRDYRVGIVAGWAVGLAVVGVYGEADEQAQRLVRAGIARVGAAITDTDALAEFR